MTLNQYFIAYSGKLPRRIIMKLPYPVCIILVNEGQYLMEKDLRIVNTAFQSVKESGYD